MISYPPALNLSLLRQSMLDRHLLNRKLGVTLQDLHRQINSKGVCGRTARPVARRGRVAHGWRAPAVARLVIRGGDDQ